MRTLVVPATGEAEAGCHLKLSVKLGVVGHILIPTLPRLRQHGEFGANSSGLARTGMYRGWGRKEKRKKLKDKKNSPKQLPQEFLP